MKGGIPMPLSMASVGEDVYKRQASYHPGISGSTVKSGIRTDKTSA